MLAQLDSITGADDSVLNEYLDNLNRVKQHGHDREVHPYLASLHEQYSSLKDPYDSKMHEDMMDRNSPINPLMAIQNMGLLSRYTIK